MKKNLVLLMLMVVSLTTCRKDIYTADACFAEDVLPIFISNCTMSGCHNSASHAHGYDLTNYDGIMKGVKPKHPGMSEIYKVIKGSNPSMPADPYSKLSNKDVTTIKLWIQMGALNNSNCRNCDTSNTTFAGRINPIVQTWCVGCHNSGSSSGGYDFTDYNGVASAVSANRLLGSLKHLSGYVAMPQNANKLQQCEIDAFEKWVNQGYPNN